MPESPSTPPPATSSNDLKAAVKIGGIALTIVVAAFLIIGLSGAGGDADPAPVYDAATPHDESAPHTHAPAAAPQPAPTPAPNTHSHGDGVPHAH